MDSPSIFRNSSGHAAAGRAPLSRTLFSPLYIFEMRYREMLEHALSQHRMFSVALMKPQRTQLGIAGDFCHIATVGSHPGLRGPGDGTSNLILQGLQRVRFTSFEQEAAFPDRPIEPLDSTALPPSRREALGAKVLELYSKLKSQRPAVSGEGGSLSGRPERPGNAGRSDGRHLRDRSALRRQQLLEELSVNQRLAARSSNICATKPATPPPESQFSVADGLPPTSRACSSSR